MASAVSSPPAAMSSAARLPTTLVVGRGRQRVQRRVGADPDPLQVGGLDHRSPGDGGAGGQYLRGCAWSAVQAHAASSAPRQIATSAPATSAGRRRSFGGGTTQGRPAPAPRRASGPLAWLCSPSPMPLASRSLLHEHLRLPDPDLHRPRAARQPDGPALPRPLPGDDPVRGRRHGVGAARLVGAGLGVDVAAVRRRPVRRSSPGTAFPPSGTPPWLPSPISQVICWTRAVAVTVIPPALADAVTGPKVWASGCSTHSHTGIPTIPTLFGPGCGVIPISIARRFICLTASCATWPGVGPVPDPAGGFGGPDVDRDVGLRLVARIDRTVAGLMSLPARVTRRRLRINRGDVAVVAVRPVAMVPRAGHRPGRRIRQPLLRRVPVTRLPRTGVLGGLIGRCARRRRRARDLHPDRAFAGRRVGLLTPACLRLGSGLTPTADASDGEQQQRRCGSGCRAWRLLEILAGRDAPAACRVGGPVVVRHDVADPAGARPARADDGLPGPVQRCRRC